MTPRWPDALRARWHRAVTLRSPEGALEAILITGAAGVTCVGAGLLSLAAVLFLGCGPSLCGYFAW